jgi:hypothetical protein
MGFILDVWTSLFLGIKARLTFNFDDDDDCELDLT